MNILVQHPNQKQPVSYKQVAPVKVGNRYEPNYMDLNRVMVSQPLFIRHSAFAEAQEKGQTILINKNGGWCLLTDKDKVIN